jgi:hypothetical protein
MLMQQQFSQPRVRRADGVPGTPASRQPQREGIDERADRQVRARTASHPPEQYSAEDHILPAGQPGQHHGPRQMAHRRDAHAQQP